MKQLVSSWNLPHFLFPQYNSILTSCSVLRKAGNFANCGNLCLFLNLFLVLLSHWFCSVILNLRFLDILSILKRLLWLLDGSMSIFRRFPSLIHNRLRNSNFSLYTQRSWSGRTPSAPECDSFRLISCFLSRFRLNLRASSCRLWLNHLGLEPGVAFREVSSFKWFLHHLIPVLLKVFYFLLQRDYRLFSRHDWRDLRLITHGAFWRPRLLISFNNLAFSFQGVLVEKIYGFEVVLYEDFSFWSFVKLVFLCLFTFFMILFLVCRGSIIDNILLVCQCELGSQRLVESLLTMLLALNRY